MKIGKDGIRVGLKSKNAAIRISKYTHSHRIRENRENKKNEEKKKI